MSLYLKTILMIIAFMLLISPCGAQDDTVGKFASNVIQLTVKLPDKKYPSYGFGFVVGELENKLYVVTASHVVFPDGLKPEKIEARFFRQGTTSFSAKLLQHAYMSPNGVELDLALLEVPKPPNNYQWERTYFYPYPKKNDRVWFIGKQKKWYIATDAASGNISDAFMGEIRVDMYSVLPGTSGAPLIAKEGIVGMIIADSPTEVIALDIATIRYVVTQEWNFPWHLQEYGAAETTPDRIETRKPPAKEPVAAVPAKPEKGKLFVTAEPENANVRLLNVKEKFYQGVALEPGEYEIEVSADKYETAKIRAAIKAGDDTRESVRLEPVPETSLIIQCDVADAEVWINDKKMGNGSMRFDPVQPGFYAIKVKKDGYVPFETDVKIKQGESREITARLLTAQDKKRKMALPPLERILAEADKHKKEDALSLAQVLDEIDKQLQEQDITISYTNTNLESDSVFNIGTYKLSDRGMLAIEENFLKKIIAEKNVYKRQYPDSTIIIKIKVVGYTDMVGLDEKKPLFKEITQYLEDGVLPSIYESEQRRQFLNQRLSELRAKAISQYIKKQILDSESENSWVKIESEAIGRGEDLPPGVTPGSIIDPRRRVCIVYISTTILSR